MLAEGNGTRQQCAANLIKTLRGECPYERAKGLDRTLIDTPSVDVAKVKADVSWLIDTYEPRIDRFQVKVDAKDAEVGAFGINLVIE